MLDNRERLFGSSKRQLPTSGNRFLFLKGIPGISISFGKQDIQFFHSLAILKLALLYALFYSRGHLPVKNRKIGLPALPGLAVSYYKIEFGQYFINGLHGK
jgi:hypothetical protein